jgi:hypothetical protein
MGLRSRLRGSGPTLRRDQGACKRLSGGGSIRAWLGVRSRLSGERCQRVPSLIPGGTTGSAIEAIRKLTSPACPSRCLSTDTSTHPETAGDANGVSGRAAACVNLSSYLGKRISHDREETGNAIVGTGGLTMLASRSTCLSSATSPPRDATGSVSGVTRKTVVRAWPQNEG